jgi:uncharacterized membrane protein
VSRSEFSIKEVTEIRTIALTVAFTAMVFVSTYSFSLAIAASRGYFNIGEIFVYLAALIGGPIVGAIAGGLGAALADLFLAPIYAPATLIIKGLEGFIAGYLYKNLYSIGLSKKFDQRIKILILVVITILLVGLPVYYTTPELNGTPGTATFFLAYTELPGIVLVIMSIVLCIILWITIFFLGEKGPMILSCLISGVIIIVGYAIYQVFFVQYTVIGAVIEMPFNVLQVLIGTVVAIPVVSYLQDLGIIPEYNNNSKSKLNN